MPSQTVPLVLESTSCWKCGIIYAAPQDYMVSLRRRGGSIRCPSGHKGHYPKPAPPVVKGKRAKKVDIRAIHEAEQAEARKAEGKA